MFISNMCVRLTNRVIPQTVSICHSRPIIQTSLDYGAYFLKLDKYVNQSPKCPQLVNLTFKWQRFLFKLIKKSHINIVKRKIISCIRACSLSVYSLSYNQIFSIHFFHVYIITLSLWCDIIKRDNSRNLMHKLI